MRRLRRALEGSELQRWISSSLDNQAFHLRFRGLRVTLTLTRPCAYSLRQRTTRLLRMVRQKAQAAPGEEDRGRATPTATTTLCATWRTARLKKASWVRIIGSDWSVPDDDLQTRKWRCIQREDPTVDESRRSEFFLISLLPESFRQ